MQLGLAFWGSKTLLSAIELDVFSHLAQGPLDERGLRARVGFAETRVEHLCGPDAMVVGVK